MGARPAVPADPALLAALLHDAERVIDHQVQAIEELDDKSEHMIGLGVALLAGGLSMAVFVAGREATPRPGWAFFWCLCAGGAANLLALAGFVEAYIGFRHGVEVVVGPSIHWVGRKASDRAWTLRSHIASLLSAHGYPAYYEFNLRRMVHAARARRFGLLCLAVAVVLFTGAFLLILEAAI